MSYWGLVVAFYSYSIIWEHTRHLILETMVQMIAYLFLLRSWKSDILVWRQIFVLNKLINCNYFNISRWPASSGPTNTALSHSCPAISVSLLHDFAHCCFCQLTPHHRLWTTVWTLFTDERGCAGSLNNYFVVISRGFSLAVIKEKSEKTAFYVPLLFLKNAFLAPYTSAMFLYLVYSHTHRMSGIFNTPVHTVHSMTHILVQLCRCKLFHLLCNLDLNT